MRLFLRIRAFLPIGAPHEFPPTKYQPDKDLYAIDRRIFVPVDRNRTVICS
jgi:hypothetical protein